MNNWELTEEVVEWIKEASIRLSRSDFAPIYKLEIDEEEWLSKLREWGID